MYNCKKQRRLYNSLKKYGWEKHKFEIIYECNPAQLNELEKYYVNLFQTFNSTHGLNLKEGGGNNKLSEETKNKISISLIGNKRTLGRKLSAGHKRKISLSETGKKKPLLSEVTKLKMSIAKKNMSIETRKKLSDAKKKNPPKYWLNKNLSNEHKLNISEGQKNRYKNKNLHLCYE